MIGEPMVVHDDSFLRKRRSKIGLKGNPMLLQVVAEELLDAVLFGPGNAHAVLFHPAFQPAEGVGAAQRQHPAPVLAGDQLPGGAEKVPADNFAGIIILLKGPGRRPPGAHAHRPAHHPVLLRLHGPQPLHHLIGRSELGANQLLVQEPGGNRVHGATSSCRPCRSFSCHCTRRRGRITARQWHF